MELLTTHIIKKDLEIQICDNLTRHQNKSTRASKTPKALWYLRINLNHKALPPVNLNAYEFLIPDE